MTRTNSEAIGYYFAPIMGGSGVENVQYGKKSYFGIRDIPSYVPLDSKKFVQILVKSIGSKAWINVRRECLI